MNITRIMLIAGLTFLLLLHGCLERGPRETITVSANAGETVRLSIQEQDLKDGATIEWRFTDTPIEPSLRQSDFAPIHTAPRVRFIPPVPGDYIIAYNVKDKTGTMVGSQRYRVKVEGQPVADTGESAPGEAPEAPPGQQSGSEAETSEEEARVAEESADQSAEPPTAAVQGTPPAQETTPSGVTAGRYTVQVASYQKRASALSTQEQLEDAGYPAFIQESRVNDQHWYRVRVGRFATRAEAREVARKLDLDANVAGQGFWVDELAGDE